MDEMETFAKQFTDPEAFETWADKVMKWTDNELVLNHQTQAHIFQVQSEIVLQTCCPCQDEYGPIIKHFQDVK